ncbi:MAG: hypothetical protein NTX25_10550 [Proteobacteria bacterium]|nr:hypothetical protein [Pseudomonadota bacterium]
MLNILDDSSFFQILQSYDVDICKALQANDCSHCGGKLDASHYQRKLRGIEWAELTEECSRRYSLCCRDEGCRKRSTPLSLRFAGRKVYCSLLIMLFTLLKERGDGKAQRRLQKDFGLSAMTARRWTRLFQSALAASHWARAMRAGGGLISRWIKILSGIYPFWGELVAVTAG